VNRVGLEERDADQAVELQVLDVLNRFLVELERGKVQS
jgi:hypothetical protein